MSTENPDISMLLRTKPTKPPECPSCQTPWDPHNGECLCS